MAASVDRWPASFWWGRFHRVMVPVFPGCQGIIWRCSQFLVVFRSSTFAVQFSPHLIPLQELATRPEWGDGTLVGTCACAIRSAAYRDFVRPVLQLLKPAVPLSAALRGRSHQKAVLCAPPGSIPQRQDRYLMAPALPGSGGYWVALAIGSPSGDENQRLAR